MAGEQEPEAGQEPSLLPEAGWRAPSVALGVLIAAAVLVFGTIPIAIADPELESTAANDLAQLVVALALVGTALGFALRDRGGELREALRSLGLKAIAWRGVGAAIVAWLIYLIIAAVLSPLLQPEQEDVTRSLGVEEESVIPLIAAGLLIVVAAPLAEEIFFRGFMYTGLRRSMPIMFASLISALVWGALHLSGGNIGVAAQLAIFGIVLAALYERTGTLWAPIIAHTINNSIAFTILVVDPNLVS